jgi:hypothetical protein
MKFEDFKRNVEQWAQVRGIYDQSTEDKQVDKFIEEHWEFVTAEDDQERGDAVGDMAVCIVNAAKLAKGNALMLTREGYDICIDDVCLAVKRGHYNEALNILHTCVEGEKFAIDETFNQCLKIAWDEIKDRKGMMIDGLFVKWENLTPEQQGELQARLDSHIEADC